jgi:hypothetical protein
MFRISPRQAVMQQKELKQDVSPCQLRRVNGRVNFYENVIPTKKEASQVTPAMRALRSN